MNHEPTPSAVGDSLNPFGGSPLRTLTTDISTGSDEAFQKLLLRLAAKASDGPDAGALIQFFCRTTREFFQVAGVYFWRCRSQHEDELVGQQGDGKLAELFVGLRLRSMDSAVTAEAVRRRRATFANRVSPDIFPEAAKFQARSLMAAPLVVFNEVIGAVTFLNDQDENFFNEDMVAKATILAGQLGSLLEAARLSEASREERRRAEILADVAQVLHGTPDVSAVIEALADRLRLLLRAQLVCVLLGRDGPFELRAVSAETPQLANSVRARHDRKTIRFAADLAQRAVTAGEPITLSIGEDVHSLGNLVSAGMLIAAPLRASRTRGAILVYPRHEGVFTAEEKSLVAAIAGFGAVAVAHAELYATAHAQAHELHQLLEISSTLSASGDLEQFLQAFVVRAADFLGFGRCFIALYEAGEFHLRYAVAKGEPRRLEQVFPEGVATRTLRSKEVFWTDEASKTPGVNLDVVLKYEVHQFLAVPLLGADGQLLGMFGVLDRLDGTGIAQEDIRRARALGNQVAVVLEVARNLHLSERHRRRAEALIELAREINSVLHLPDFARRFVCRAAELTGAQAGALVVFQDGRPQTLALYPDPTPSSEAPSVEPPPEQADRGSPATAARTEIALLQPEPVQSSAASGSRAQRALESQLQDALADLASRHAELIVTGPAAELLSPEVAASTGWHDCTAVRLPGPNGELAGMLCLADRSRPLGEEDRAFLEAMASHAAMALENARLFTAVEQANRHWLEIFDAITDFIVAHDESDKVVRVNRSLATLIGVPPSELIGVNMRALMALTGDVASYSCPFCRSMANDNDEFVHPVFDHTYLVSTSRVHGAASEGVQTIHVMKDITDRREAERRYRELFDNIQEGLFFSTPAGRFIEVNDAMVRMLGYSSREELLQIDIPSQLYFSSDQSLQHAEVMKENGHLRNFEATLRRKNGLPIHVLINAFGLYDNQGRLMQIRGLMLDVTGLRAYQSELHRERDFSSKILNNTQSLILVADTAGLISYANRRWSDSGFEQRDLLGRPLIALAAPAYVFALSEAIRNTLSGQQVDNLELQIVRGSGPPGQFSANLSPMRDEPGNVVSIVAVLTDITDSSVLRGKLIHQEKMAAVGQLVSGVAHEVNNPLTAILGFADLLMESPDLPESVRKDLRIILQEAQRTKQIVQNLLSFARQMPPQRNPVQLNSVLRRTLQLRSYDFTSHGIEVIEHLDQGLPEVIGDAHQLQQVFLNILNNAYDAVHELGRPARIEIMTAGRGETVEISFCDNGHGIAQPDRIFDPFFTTKEVGKGTGLGLSICYGIVKEHGGEILCHNNTDGQGATFIVRLPAAARPVSASAAAGAMPT
ncbi:MAG TPA: PAS domain-containing protein [Candidatus Sulfotelmatobacter sp.]|nr:PAS domain-containing protein [Candidatus Sulfotelmatobacter sp.]